MIFVWVVLILLTVALVLLSGATMEMYSQLRQIRRLLQIEDVPLELDLAQWQGRSASDAGLPPELDHATVAVLILSESCATCHELARELDGTQWPDSLWVLLAEDPDSTGSTSLSERYRLYEPQLIRDAKRGIPERIGLTISPAAFLLQDGKFAEARTVPSAHQLDLLLKDISPIRR